VKQHPKKPIRLVDLPREQDPDQVGLLIRSASAAPSDDTPAVKWRIRNTLHQRGQRRVRVLRFAMTSTIIFIAGSVAGAVVSPLLRTRLLGLILLHKEPSSGAPAGHGGRREFRQPSPPAEQPSPPVATVPIEDTALSAQAPPPSTIPKARATPRRVVASHLTARSGDLPRAEPQPFFPSQPLVPPDVPAPVMPAPGASAAVPASATPSEEHQLITSALQKLRTSHEPEAALAALDDYRRRFPSGQLAPEAARLRAEALLLLGRKATLREELDRSLPSETPASDERVVLRGELRAATGRWQAALADFDAVVRAHPASSGNGMEINDRRMRERLERALWGRASARSHMGDDAGARADLREYVERFPDGRFAAQADQLLDQSR
jgi:TolA-binding protein